MAFAKQTELGLSSRGIRNPLQAYASSMNIESEHLTLSDNVWVDQNGCIARRNWLPFQTSAYLEALRETPFDFGVGPALTAANEAALEIVEIVENSGNQ